LQEAAVAEGEETMKKIVIMLITVVLLPLGAIDLEAAADRQEFPVKHAMTEAAAKDKLLDVPIFMKGADHPEVVKRMGEFKANRKTNAWRKPAQEACDHAFLSAVIALQERAQREGGNAVVDVYSITKDVKYVDAEKYSCVAGKTVVHVALMGTVATIKK
jgi:hypothetical protein